MHDKDIKWAFRKFTALHAEHIRRTVKPAKLTLINSFFASSDDGALELGRYHGGDGVTSSYRFMVADRGNIFLKAGNFFDKNDDCNIVIGLKTFDGNLNFMKNRYENDGEMIISTFSWFLLEAFDMDHRENLGNIDVHQPNPRVKVTFDDNL